MDSKGNMTANDISDRIDDNNGITSLGSLIGQIKKRVGLAGSRVRQNLSNVPSSLVNRRMSSPGKSFDASQPFETKKIQQIWPEGEVPWLLSDYQRSLVKRTWRDDFEVLYKLGTSIYAQVFQSAPDAKVLFPQVAKAGEEWQNSGKFKSQALKFVQVLSHIVKNLYHPEQMDALLYRVGVAHRKYAGRGFKPSHWAHFQSAIEIAMTNQMNDIPGLSEQEKVDAIEAWKFISLYLMRKMKRGFLDDTFA